MTPRSRHAAINARERLIYNDRRYSGRRVLITPATSDRGYGAAYRSDSWGSRAAGHFRPPFTTGVVNTPSRRQQKSRHRRGDDVGTANPRRLNESVPRPGWNSRNQSAGPAEHRL